MDILNKEQLNHLLLGVLIRQKAEILVWLSENDIPAEYITIDFATLETDDLNPELHFSDGTPLSFNPVYYKAVIFKANSHIIKSMQETYTLRMLGTHCYEKLGVVYMCLEDTQAGLRYKYTINPCL